MKRITRVYAVLVEQHTIRMLTGTRHGDLDRELQEAIQSISGIPYPAQYGRAGVYVVADDNGLCKGLPYNRWGLVGTFAVMGRGDRPLSEKRVDEIVSDVEDRDGGYLDEASKVLNGFRDALRVRGIPPAGAVPRTGRWFR